MVSIWGMRLPDSPSTNRNGWPRSNRKTGDQILVATMRYSEKKTAEIWVFASIADFQSRCREMHDRGIKVRWGEPPPCG